MSSLLFSFVLALLWTNGDAVKYHVVDLTHELNDDTVYWPGNPAYNLTILSRGQFPDYWYESNYIAQPEHGGTHLDSPSHFFKGAWRTQQIPMSRLHGPGVIINVKDKVRSDPDYRVTVDDVRDWEQNYGAIPRNAMIVMNSGWGEKYPNKTKVFGTATVNDPTYFHFPGWHEDTVTWLINNRHFNTLGVDTPSNDFGQSKTFPVHVILSRENKSGLENVANLDKISEAGVEIFAPVIKTFEGSGGPVRMFALVYDADEPDVSSAVLLSSASYVTILLLLVAWFV